MKELFKSYKKDVFSIPNCLSYFRIVLIPIFVYLYMSAKNKNWYIAATIVLIISGITDSLDGLIARKFNMVTEFGKLLDPFADKLTQFAVAVSLIARYRQMWLLAIIVMVKELTMAACCYHVYKKYQKKINGAKWYGKINTTIFYVAMVALVAFYSIPLYIVNLLLLISSVSMVITLILYLKLFFDICKENIG